MATTGDYLDDVHTFCIKAHQGQTRWNGEPYFHHPEHVVEILEFLGFDGPTTLAAAYLHDVLEDTKTDPQEIERLFGKRVLELVKELSHHCSSTEQYLEYVEGLSYEAKVIKMADIISNLSGDDKKSSHFVDKRIRALAIILKSIIKP